MLSQQSDTPTDGRLEPIIKKENVDMKHGNQGTRRLAAQIVN
jgi:hypothetical protein